MFSGLETHLTILGLSAFFFSVGVFYVPMFLCIEGTEFLLHFLPNCTSGIAQPKEGNQLL